MKRTLIGLAVAGLLLVWGARPAAADPIGYTLDVTTHYQFGTPPGAFADRGGASPDSGDWTITNNGASTFSGTIGQIAVSPFYGDHSYSHVVTLAPGAHVTFVVDFESSNGGGFNGPYLTVQPGVKIFLSGAVTLGADSEAVSLSVLDSDIHSGVFRTNPYGVHLDNYVLQGGDPFGRDTGDGYEVTQADGHYRFFEQPQDPVPEPGSLTLLGLGAVGLFGYGWRRRKTAVA